MCTTILAGNCLDEMELKEGRRKTADMKERNGRGRGGEEAGKGPV